MNATPAPYLTLTLCARFPRFPADGGCFYYRQTPKHYSSHVVVAFHRVSFTMVRLLCAHKGRCCYNARAHVMLWSSKYMQCYCRNSMSSLKLYGTDQVSATFLVPCYKTSCCPLLFFSREASIFISPRKL